MEEAIELYLETIDEKKGKKDLQAILLAYNFYRFQWNKLKPLDAQSY